MEEANLQFSAPLPSDSGELDQEKTKEAVEENFEPSSKKSRTDAAMEITEQPTTTSLKSTSSLITVERNYIGTPKDGSLKGEVEWTIWDSDDVLKDERGCFSYHYVEHHEEHALIIEGKAIITPKSLGENFESIHVSKGDYLIFKKGLYCEWQIQQRIKKRYCFFDEKGEPVVAGEKIACDKCGRDCTDESVGVKKPNSKDDNVEDLCLPCYRLYKDNYSEDGEHLVNGTVVGDLSSVSTAEMKRKIDEVK